MACRGQTCAQTVQPTHCMGSMTAFLSRVSNESAGQPVDRHFLQPMHFFRSIVH